MLERILNNLYLDFNIYLILFTIRVVRVSQYP